MYITNISEAKANLSLLIKELLETHEPIIIGKAGKPVAVLTPFDEKATPRKLYGDWKGRVTQIEMMIRLKIYFITQLSFQSNKR